MMSRKILFYIIAIFALASMTTAVFSYQVIDGKKYKAQSQRGQIKTEIIDAARGIVYDAQNRPLIQNRSVYGVYIEPIVYSILSEDKKQQVLESTSKILGISSQEILDIYNKNSNQAEALIKNNISYDDIGAKIIADSTSFPAIKVKKNYIREYISSDVNSHILGYTGQPNQKEIDTYKLREDDMIGKSGLEAQYDTTLRGTNGTKVIERNLSDESPEYITQEPKTGKSLGLAIDLELQKQISISLSEAIKNSGADGGVGVIQKIDTGDIVGMVSLPIYDSNKFVQGMTAKEVEALYNDPKKPTFDRSIQGGFAPGSTFKTITGIAVLSSNAITKDTVYSTGSFPYKDQVFYDFNKNNYGNLNIEGGLCKSSNIFFMKAAEQLDNNSNYNAINILDEYGTRFGLGQKTGIDLPGETEGVLSSIKYTTDVRKEQWLPGYLMTTSIGQQDTLTSPIQMVNWASAIANGGTLYQPRLVNRIIDSDTNEVEQIKPKILREKIADPEIINIIKSGMRCSANGGAAGAINSRVVSVAAKTGTAEFGERDDKGEYKFSQAWVMGFFPYENPKYSFAFLLERGGLSSGAAFSAKVVIDWFAQTYSDKLK